MYGERELIMMALSYYRRRPGSDSKPLSRWMRMGLADIKFSLISVKYIHQKGHLPAVEVISTASGRENWADLYHRQRIHSCPPANCGWKTQSGSEKICLIFPGWGW